MYIVYYYDQCCAEIRMNWAYVVYGPYRWCSTMYFTTTMHELQGQHICVVAVGVKKWGAEQRRLLGDNYNH